MKIDKEETRWTALILIFYQNSYSFKRMKYTTRWILINLTAIFFQEFSVQVTFREQWNDERLRYVDSTRGTCPVLWRKFSSTLFVQYGEIYWNRVRSCLCLPMTFINWLIHCSLVSLRLDWCDSINQSINQSYNAGLNQYISLPG